MYTHKKYLKYLYLRSRLKYSYGYSPDKNLYAPLNESG